MRASGTPALLSESQSDILFDLDTLRTYQRCAEGATNESRNSNIDRRGTDVLQLISTSSLGVFGVCFSLETSK